MQARRGIAFGCNNSGRVGAVLIAVRIIGRVLPGYRVAAKRNYKVRVRPHATVNYAYFHAQARGVVLR